MLLYVLFWLCFQDLEVPAQIQCLSGYNGSFVSANFSMEYCFPPLSSKTYQWTSLCCHNNLFKKPSALKFFSNQHTEKQFKIKLSSCSTNQMNQSQTLKEFGWSDFAFSKKKGWLLFGSVECGRSSSSALLLWFAIKLNVHKQVILCLQQDQKRF